MPYIQQDQRVNLVTPVGVPQTAGELNYVLTCVCIEYMKEHGLKYQTINDIVGALEGAKLEFYRRVAAPYEDTKISQNGDVYP